MYIFLEISQRLNQFSTNLKSSCHRIYRCNILEEYSEVPNFRINLEIRILSGYLTHSMWFKFLFELFKKFPAFCFMTSRHLWVFIRHLIFSMPGSPQDVVCSYQGHIENAVWRRAGQGRAVWHCWSKFSDRSVDFSLFHTLSALFDDIFVSCI